MRITVRRMMLAVLGIGLALHLAITAEKARGNDLHRHSWMLMEDGRPVSCHGVVRDPFWIRYGRCLLGWPRSGPGVCRPPQGLHEFCWMQPFHID